MPRLRLSAWADPQVVIHKQAIQSKDRFKPGAAHAGYGHLDELSLLITFTTNETMKLI